MNSQHCSVPEPFFITVREGKPAHCLACYLSLQGESFSCRCHSGRKQDAELISAMLIRSGKKESEVPSPMAVRTLELRVGQCHG